MTDDRDQAGPIDYLVVEFHGNRMTGEAFPLLIDLVDRGLIRILDLMFLRKQPDGSLVTLTPSGRLTNDGYDLSIFNGASSGLVAEDDLEAISGVLEPGSDAGILIYENVWAAPFAAALRRAGGELVASGRIPAQVVLEVLEAVESAA